MDNHDNPEQRQPDLPPHRGDRRDTVGLRIGSSLLLAFSKQGTVTGADTLAAIDRNSPDEHTAFVGVLRLLQIAIEDEIALTERVSYVTEGVVSQDGEDVYKHKIEFNADDTLRDVVGRYEEEFGEGAPEMLRSLATTLVDEGVFADKMCVIDLVGVQKQELEKTYAMTSWGDPSLN